MATKVKVDRLGRGEVLRGAEVVNTTDVPTDMVAAAVAGAKIPNDPYLAALHDSLTTWVQRTSGAHVPTRRGGLLDRDRFLTPYTYFQKVKTCRRALSDDVVGNAADGTESLALSEVGILSEESDDQDVWNQIAADLNFDNYVRAAWRTLFTDSAFVTAMWWGRKTYKVRGKTVQGNDRRKTYNLTVPLAVTLLDTARVVPVGSLAFGMEQLAYVAEPFEAAAIRKIIKDRDSGEQAQRRADATRVDQFGLADLFSTGDSLFLGADVISRLIVSEYTPDLWERDELLRDGVEDINNLFLLDPRAVFRHTLTRPDFRRFPDVRLESVLQLLDIKQQLRHSDRTHLIGGANMIILITKGTDDKPATQAEVDNLRRNAQVLASMPVVTADHRLKIEIITPKLDMTLSREKHDTIDSRIFARAWQTFVPTGQDANDDPMKLGRVIGRGLEGRRRMMRRTFEAKILDRIRVLNDMSRGKVIFNPASVSLAFDSAWASFLLDLRELGEISRETLHSQFDLDQADEALALRREQEPGGYDEIFPTRLGQFSGNGGGALVEEPDDPDSGGSSRQVRRAGGRRTGGNRSGGGAAPGTNQGQKQDPRQIERKGRRGRTERTATDAATDEDEGQEET